VGADDGEETKSTGEARGRRRRQSLWLVNYHCVFLKGL
jgi:hypothetical protein